MLNPFHGIVNAVEIEGADAVSRDGLNWSLYVQYVDDDGAQYPDIKFGDWSEAEGLKRYPMRYVEDYAALDHKGEELLKIIRALQEKLPFPAADCHELWLLDKTSMMPLALVGSACEQPPRALEQSIWRVGVTARKSFESDSVCELLEALINDQAATLAVWLLRKCDGTGIEVETGRKIPASKFPQLGVTEDWVADQASKLVATYLHWQAPWLLELPTLDEPSRQQLETQAMKRSELVSERYRNYPQVVNQASLNAALVEAKIRDANRFESDGEAEEVIDFFQSGN